MITPNVARLTNELFDWLDEVDENHFDKEDDKKLRQMLDALAAADPNYRTYDVEASLARFKEEYQELFDCAKKTAAVLGPTKKFKSPKKKRCPKSLSMIYIISVLSAFCAGSLLWYTGFQHGHYLEKDTHTKRPPDFG